MQSYLGLSSLSAPWSSLAHLQHYMYVEVGQARLLPCCGSDCQVSEFFAILPSVMSSKFLVAISSQKQVTTYSIHINPYLPPC